MEYVYLAASLPTLALTERPPLTSQSLLASARGLLREDHWRDLCAIVEDRPQDVRSPEGRRYVDADTRLRNALARLRARRAGADAAPYLREHEGFDARAEDTAARAMAEEDPLTRELLLDRFRWTVLDEIAAFPAFGVQAVFAYGFKLRLVEKWAGVSEERGMAVARQVVEDALAGSAAATIAGSAA